MCWVEFKFAVIMDKKVVSRYCYLFKTSKSVCLAYSSKTNSFIELSEDLFDILNKSITKGNYVVPHDLPDNILKILEHEGIVCGEQDDDDYVTRCQFITQSVQHDKSKLNLVLVPTLNCNFNCPYCFENGKKVSRMDDNTINNLIAFIRESEYAKELTLTWYGGEPLLAFQVIEKILNRISSELSIKITRHSMITNGYMINDDVIRLFQKYPLDSMQITLDGTKERHNKLRSLKANHAPTYDRIIDNIDTVVNKLPNTELHVRVNIDKNNVNDFFQINEELKNKYKDKRIVVYPGIIRLENEERTNLVEPAFGRWETAYLLFDLYNKGIIDGNIYPTHRIAKTCCALCVNSYIIGPTGEIYKCWNDVSDMSKVIGHINKPDIENKTLYYRYHEGCAWYNDSLCKSCFFLPICNGKCAWYNERNLYHGANYNLCQCLQKAPGLLNKCLESFYESQMTKSE